MQMFLSRFGLPSEQDSCFQAKGTYQPIFVTGIHSFGGRRAGVYQGGDRV